MNPAELVRAYARPNKKSLGQHFLTQTATLDRIVSVLGSPPPPHVIEVGPGPGTLTSRLRAAGIEVTAIEIDRDACAFLGEVFGEDPGFRLRPGDAASTDILPELLAETSVPVVGNLPYNVANEIMFRAIDAEQRPARMVLMFQLEVAERVACQGHSSHFSPLSLNVANRYEARIALRLPPGAFFPPPKVDSAVVLLERRPTPLVDGEAERWMRKLSHAAFTQRRKMLRGSLRSVLDEPERWLSQAGIAGETRPEALDVHDFARLARLLAAAA